MGRRHLPQRAGSDYPRPGEVSRSPASSSRRAWRCGEKLGDRAAVARALSNLANVVKLQGDYAQARSLYEECLSIFTELGDRTGMAWSLNHQGDMARSQGDPAGARALYEQSLATFRELGDRWGIAGSLVDLGNLTRDQKEYALAPRRSIGKACGSSRSWDTSVASRACWNVSQLLAAAQSQPGRSLRLAGAAAALRQAVGAPLPPANRPRLKRVWNRRGRLWRRSLPPPPGWRDGECRRASGRGCADVGPRIIPLRM